MPITYNGYGNCNLNAMGSGRGLCDNSDFGDFDGTINFRKGAGRYLLSGTFATLFLGDVKGLRAFPDVNIWDFEEANAEDEIATSSTQRQSIVRSGKPAITVTYNNGACLHKARYSKRGNGQYDFAYVFENGILMALSTDGLAVEPFEGGMYNVNTLNLQSGTDQQRSVVNIQLDNAKQFNERHVFLTWEDLGITKSDLYGVIETNMTIVGTPTAGDPIEVRVTSGCNSQSPVEGLDSEEFWSVIGTLPNGAAVTAATYNTATGTYSLTITPPLVLGNIVQALLNDGTYNVVEDADGMLFKGITPAKTVVA